MKEDTQVQVILGVMVTLFVLVVGFVVWGSIIWIFSWVFGFEFMWRYVVGAWLGTAVLRSIFGSNK